MRVKIILCWIVLVSFVFCFSPVPNVGTVQGKKIDNALEGEIAKRLPADATNLVTEVVSFTATPSAIRKGETATLRWRVSGEAENILLIRDRQLPAIKRVEASGQLTVTPEKTSTYQLLVRFGDQALESTITVRVVERGSPILWQAQACLEIENHRSDGPFNCKEPESCFTTDPGDGSKRMYDNVSLLLRFRDLPIGNHKIDAYAWRGHQYPANAHIARYDKSFTFRNREENWSYWFPIGSDGRTKYWRIRIFLNNNWVGDAEYRLCR